MNILAHVLAASDRSYTSKFQRRFPALAAIVMGRNVANVSSIEDFLKSFHGDNSEINRWLDTTMRKWLIRDFDKTTPYKAQDSDPEWMKGKEDLILVKLDDDIRGKVEHVVDFLKAQAAQNPDLKLNNFQAVEAFKQAAQWMEALMKKKIEEEVPGKDYEILLEDGPYRWVKLISENALAREGRLMGHCVGGYWPQVKTGVVEIYSMRDSKNEPHVTIEYQSKRSEINQIKGKQNKALKDEYRPTMVNFLNAKKFNWRKINEYDAGMNGLLITGNGLVIDRENIPNGSVLKGPIKNYEGGIKFPESIKILGDFIANDYQKSLPSKRFEVTGTCDLSNGAESRRWSGYDMPEELIVGKDFIGSGNLMEELPKKFSVSGDVLLDGCNLLKLPDNLKIKGELDISDNPIKRLPKNLQVAGELDLMDTEITEIPEDLKALDSIYVDDDFDMDKVPEHLKDQVFA